MSLEKQVHVASRFQRSVRIDTDVHNATALDGFLCTHSFERALATLAENLRLTGHGAYTWTGPYGGGKSVLVVALAGLIGPKGKQRSVAERAVGDRVARNVIAAFKPGTQGWVTLPIVGARASAHVLVWEALRAARLIQPKGVARCPSAREVLQLLIRVSERESHNGLLVAIDELGKVLEEATSSAGDLHFLQDLAEMASRSKGRLCFVGILHQAFEEYGARLHKEARDEWAKVQGRFIDIPLSPTGSEQLELLARAISAAAPAKKYLELVENVSHAVRRNRDDTPVNNAAVLKRCWPLHPVTACLLGPISRRRFGQNQRSLFAFLNSREPAGFQDFLHAATGDALYEPEQLFDYLQLNLEPAILASPDGHRWALAIDAIERAEKRGADKLSVVLLKSIALLDLFRERSGLFASKEVLRTLVPTLSSKELDRALEQLRQWSVLAYREHLSAYAIYAGSDFDLQAALDQAKVAVKEPDLRALRQLANLRPIIAKRHYHETGAFRWLEVDVVTSAELPGRVGGFTPHGAIGQIFVLIPRPQDTDKALRSLAEEASRESAHPCLVGVCSTSSRITELTLELLELEHIRSNHPQLRDDMVARREVDARAATAAHLLEIEIRNAFASARFYHEGQRTDVQGLTDLSRYASDVADAVYCDSPKIVSELLNRGAPSSNAVAAQKALLRAMVLNPTAAMLGIEGFPPERGLYDSILESTSLHRTCDDRVGFYEPTKKDDSRLRALWKATDKFLSSAQQAPVSAADVYRMFAGPPFGIRNGLRPILFLAYLQSRPERYTVYVDGVLEARLNDFAVDRLIMDPTSVSLRVFDPNEYQRQLLDGARSTLRDLGAERTFELADTTALARALVSVVRSQPPFVLRTHRLSASTVALRAVLRAASDPNVLLHETLPNTLQKLAGDGKSSLREQLAVLDGGVREIATAYEAMLGRIDRTIRSELGVVEGELGDLEIHQRAERISGLTGDLRLEAFITRMCSYRADTASIEGVGSLAANKPTRDWSDNDFDAALLEASTLAQRFNRAEAFARVKGRPDGRHAISIVVGLDRSPRVVSTDFEITERDRRKVLEIARLISNLGRGTTSEVLLAALAQAGSELISAETHSAQAINA